MKAAIYCRLSKEDEELEKDGQWEKNRRASKTRNPC